MVRVKICANKSVEDAKMCIDAGADIIELFKINNLNEVV